MIKDNVVKNRIDAWKHFYPEGNGNAKPGFVLHHKDPTLKHNDFKRYRQWRVEDLEMLTLEEHAKIHHKGKHVSEKTKKLQSEGLIKKYQDPEFKKKFMERFDEEFRERLSEKMKDRWSNSEYRDRAIASMIAAQNIPEVKEKNHQRAVKQVLEGRCIFSSEFSKAQWADPVERAKRIESLKKSNGAQELRDKVTKRMIGNTITKGTHWWTNGEINKMCLECPGDGWKRGQTRLK